MLEILQFATALIALWGAITGSLSLYLRYVELKAKKPSLIAWVLSASYMFQKEKEEKYHNMDLEVDLLVQNKGGRDTSISNAFAEVRVGKHIGAIHSAEGKISFKGADGKIVSGSIFMPTGDSKNLHVVFKIQTVDPLTIQRSLRTLTTGFSILQMPIKAGFTIRHTHGSLEGSWFVYSKHQKFHQRITEWMGQQRVREGKPHWAQK